jgi:predicted RNA-binding Zn ribbon-like protein
MRPSQRFNVPAQVALLYDFANTLDLRRYARPDAGSGDGDAIATPQALQDWMHECGLLAAGKAVSGPEHARAIALRQALRAFLQAEPASRPGRGDLIGALDAAVRDFPLTLGMATAERLTLRPAAGTGDLAHVLAQLYALGQAGQLHRLRMCASHECHWVFFDRSKPGNRRWCTSLICGNREKTRAYRRRHKTSSGPDHA